MPTASITKSLSAAEYHAVDAVSASRLELFIKSPRLYQAKFMLGMDIDDDSDRDALDLGTASHAWILQPDAFEEQVALIPEEVLGKGNKRNTKAYREWAAENAGKALVKAVDFAKAKAMRRAVQNHPVAADLLAGTVACEQSFFWESLLIVNGNAKLNLISRKAKLDLISRYRGKLLVADLKTTRAVGPEDFARSAHRYGYHRQLAYYLEAAREGGYDPDGAVLIVVGSTPPHIVRVYELDQAAIRLGQSQITDGLSNLAAAITMNCWEEPGENLICELSLPKWAYLESE